MGNEVPKLITDRDIERPCDQAQTLSAVERALLVSPTTMYLWSTPCRGMSVSPLDQSLKAVLRLCQCASWSSV